jgi:2,3-bisphosphoglycerate-independent phosphoglycerate mutase
MKQKVALLILDGWGLGPNPAVDAIAQASTPTMDHLLASKPNSTLTTFGMDVGLPEGQMGNSEVGHLNIGAGRIVYQQLAKINQAVESGELAANEVLIKAVKRAITKDKSIHLMGLLSDGGVHSHIDHLKCLIDAAEAQGARKVFVHGFLDGRDTGPTNGMHYVKDLESFIADKHTEIASLIGRYYAMDRDQRWERIKRAYELMVHGLGTPTNDLGKSIQESYQAGITDEFLEPLASTRVPNRNDALLSEGDLLICFNFRTDRPRQISRVLTQENFPEHDMERLDLEYMTMTSYDENFENIEVLFGQENLQNTLGQVLADANKRQVRIAETEKYPHVTFFFSGGLESALTGETRILIPSPKVATYDQQPEMSAPELTEAIIAHVQTNTPDFICLNFANADMVGHTGVFEAGVKAAETVDSCLGQILAELAQHDYHVIIIADHGNADFMINDDGTPNTAHTKNLVPCVYVGPKEDKISLSNGKLGDIAPTILHLLELPIPSEMTGKNLINE